MKIAKSTYLALVAVLLSPMAANADLITYTSNASDSGNGYYMTADVEVTGTSQGIYDQSGGGLASFLLSMFDSSGTLLFSIDDTEDTYLGFNSYLEFDAVGIVISWLLYSDTGVGGGYGYTLENDDGSVSGCGCGTLEAMFGWSHYDATGGEFYQSLDNSGTWSPVSVPEPGTLALFGLGLAAMGFSRRRRKV